MAKISPILLLVIVILAVIFFVYGLLHLLVRYLMKRPSFSAVSQSNRNRETSGSHVLQRQLQQLFLMHDSGLDQSLIDALPIFYYKDIMGLKEPFDCAVCLCEFSDNDMLRLLPLCSHAFHLNCIDTWLLSNSTCPLCRTVLNSTSPMANNPLFNFHGSRERSNRSLVESENHNCCNHNEEIMQENDGETRVFSVRLGKFRSTNEEGEIGDHKSDQMEMISSCNLDGRRCYSMGTFQYIVGSEMQVALSNEGCVKHIKGGFDQGNLVANNTEREGKKICARTRKDSFSESKIWLWSKEENCHSLSETKLNVNSFNVDVPMSMIGGTHQV